MTRLDALLERTSRTFALSIPLLPEPTRQEVLLAYLLFRIADTFEDSTEWSFQRRIAALRDFSELLADADPERARELADDWTREAPIEHEGYNELLAETPRVVAAYRELSTGARGAIQHHVTRTCEGMAEFVRQTGDEGVLQLEDVDSLRHYCYVVAGIVGEMLTELFLLGRDELAPVREALESRARHFGEGLQLTNILRDASDDAVEGRRYIGGDVSRKELFALARRDLETAAEYTLTLQGAGAERGLVAFNALPVLLAFATLDRVEEEGPGAKISRDELWSIVGRMNEALEAGTPVIRVAQTTRAS